MSEMTALEIAVLEKVVSADAAKKARKVLIPGDYDVDFTVHVTGSVKRGEDYNQNIVAKADPWLLLAAAMSKLNGVTMEKLVNDALTASPALVTKLKAEAAEGIQKVKKDTKTPCSGKVTTKLFCEIV